MRMDFVRVVIVISITVENEINIIIIINNEDLLSRYGRTTKVRSQEHNIEPWDLTHCEFRFSTVRDDLRPQLLLFR